MVNKDDEPPGQAQEPLCLLENLSYFIDSNHGRTEFFKYCIRLMSQQSSKRCLSAARRSPEYDASSRVRRISRNEIHEQ